MQGIALDTELPLYTAYGNQQKGHSFGERLVNEAEKLFSKGYEKIVLIGNDCLELTSQTLLKAANSCKEGKVIIGPTLDGGVYLIAIHRNDFDSQLFQNLAWETEQLQSSLIAYLHSISLNFDLLSVFQDIDGTTQLLEVFHSLDETHYLKRFIHSLIKKQQTFNFQYSLLTLCSIHLQSRSLRGPPVF